MSRQVVASAVSRMHLAVSFVAPGHEHSIATDLQTLASVTDESLEEATSERRQAEVAGHYGYGPDLREKPFNFANGVAFISVQGTLINRFSGSWGYVTGYNAIRAQHNAALEDDDVVLIVFDVNSYGGEAAGCFELADEIREGREIKPSLAVVDSNCCSAAYALASAASRLVVTPSGQAGSIGVITMHMDMSKMLQEWGLKVTIIAEGEHKADGNPYEALPPEVKDDIRASVKKRYGEFVELVVKNRSNLDSQAVRATQSRSYRADEALELGLIDAVQTPTQAVASYLAELGSDEPVDDEDETMTTKPAVAAAAAAAPEVTSDAAAAASEARVAERTRMGAILNCEEAKGNPALANHLATSTDMTVDAAKATLTAAGPAAAPAAPKTKATKAGPEEGEEEDDGKGEGANSNFSRAMSSHRNADLGDDEEGAGEDASGRPRVSRAAAAMRHAGISSTARKH